jgi:hypothetical protein
MTLKKRLESVIRGWFPKEPKMPRDKIKMAETKASKPKPWWWKPLWIGTILLTTISGVVTYFLLDVPLVRVIRGVALTFIGLGIAYYLRIRSSITVNRAVYIVFGASTTGLTVQCGSMFIFKAMGLPPLYTFLGKLEIIILFIIAPNLTGALIGDWIGKRRNYMLPLTP